MNSLPHHSAIAMTLALSLMLASCGDETGTGADLSDTVAEPASGTTAELTADPRFVFATTSDVSVDIDISSWMTASAMLSVCSGYSSQSGVYDIDYSSCQIRGIIENGRFAERITLPNEVVSLVAEIRPLHDVNNPSVFEWSNDGSEQFSVR